MFIFDLLGFRPNQLTAAIRNQSWKTVIDICEEHPHLAKHWTIVKLEKREAYLLPLHYAVFMSDTTEEFLVAIHVLIGAYPHALLCKESTFKRTPLHMACAQKNASEALASILLEKHPEMAMEVDSLERFPLHYVCANNTLDAITAVLNAYPEAARRRDGQGWLPLHVACHYQTNFEIVKYLVNANPDAVVAFTPLDRETAFDLISKQSDFQDKHAIMDLLMVKEKTFVPTPRTFMSSFVTDNFITPIY